jgi:hypothetical protein
MSSDTRVKASKNVKKDGKIAEKQKPRGGPCQGWGTRFAQMKHEALPKNYQ